MSESNFELMSRDELAHYIVAHRDTSDGMEARRVFIRRMAQKAKKQGIELQRPTLLPQQNRE
ncbi:hypothetical protein C7H19_17605 [Aphanothece hegewaldii CCALA 016]|uniref:Uncharacterized protein n=1 Tax=Aphanothece hegewaldii CCALA 016 TaxID=2107694 RepID=A0A2T1LUH6_9CHRO|nr:hypothetical protein [Aphanothece hegewaldii]PSF35197.1 hypothetical protein C7H19_17605 [Aphanothece hegewaldii CCALA 016]